MEQERKLKDKSLLNGKNVIAIIILAAIVVTGVLVIPKIKERNKKVEIITVSMLEDIINVSELSTFQAVYNGIAKVHSDESRIMIKYYVSYTSKITAGIDFEEIQIDVDNDNKIIKVTLPEIKITDVNVDIASMDYIFNDLDANTATVSEEAYQACIDDATSEGQSEEKIYELAKQNAENIVRALIDPFVKQLDAEYTIEIN